MLLQSGTRTVAKCRTVNSIQSEAIVIAKWGNFITKWCQYYEVKQLLQSRAVGITPSQPRPPGSKHCSYVLPQ